MWSGIVLVGDRATYYTRNGRIRDEGCMGRRQGGVATSKTEEIYPLFCGRANYLKSALHFRDAAFASQNLFRRGG